MRSPKPKIGITGPDRGGEAAWWFTRFAIWLQGGRALRISPSRNKQIKNSELHGLILGGGADINPERYGAELLVPDSSDKPKPSGFRQWVYLFLSVILFPILFLVRIILSVRRSQASDSDRKRDDLEFTLLQESLEAGIPILGICRGSQLINVHFGGSLYQNITAFYTEIPQVHTVWPEKKVMIKPGCKLDQIINAREIWVNALHKQAIDKIGNSLMAVAEEENGIIQAIEYLHHPFLIGVQWHPEYMPQIPFQRNIFKALVEEARMRSEKGLHMVQQNARANKS
mgnify:CR=1 FL=1